MTLRHTPLRLFSSLQRTVPLQLDSNKLYHHAISIIFGFNQLARMLHCVC